MSDFIPQEPPERPKNKHWNECIDNKHLLSDNLSDVIKIYTEYALVAKAGAWNDNVITRKTYLEGVSHGFKKAAEILQIFASQQSK